MELNIQNMTINITNTKPQDCINIIFSFGLELLPSAKEMQLGIDDNIICMNKSGSILVDKHNIICSLGSQTEFDLDNYLTTLKSMTNFIKENGIGAINIILEDSLAKYLNLSQDKYYEKTIFYILNFLYCFDTHKTKKTKLCLFAINFISNVSIDDCIYNASMMLHGLFMLKNLANNPSNIATPSFIANQLLEYTKLNAKVKVNILDKQAIKEEGMNTFLAVAQGSFEEPKFAVLEYYGSANNNQNPVVLIGKGITFDSGGISLKPSANMDAMKYDMCGAATVIGLFEAVIRLNLAINLVVLVPLCENMPSGGAIKPGDIIKTMSGQTVEILNTDAEGRLILCDALTYATRYHPRLVIDIATLTGGCIVALANVASAIYSNDSEVLQDMINTANINGDLVWHMPLFKEYHKMLDSKTADISNIAGWKGHASSPTAACFLEKFVDYKWVHLDIAGVADGESKFNPIGYSGATGRPFYMLIDYLRYFYTE
jgi:leucyl aminopeptidase